jgi:hypothetical protein
MADNTKRTECVKVCFTERALIDLNRLAILEDRKLADMAHVLVLRGMYGMVRPNGDSQEGPDGP